MKKRSYRKISINQFQLDTVICLVPKGRLVFAVDVAKVDMVAAFADERGRRSLSSPGRTPSRTLCSWHCWGDFVMRAISSRR